MPHYVTMESNDGATFVNVYSGVSTEDLARILDQKLAAAGYSLKEGKPGDGVYERGSRLMRILFGAFVKYFKFGVRIADAGNGTLKVRVDKQTSGMSGGLIGMGQVKTEVKRLVADLSSI
ncbi:MAG TPA: hypothetical protein VHS96_05245 [Bacteroidia bacterium]|nr:hypothetical protein [Bacteroidia bacterium]